MELELLNYQKYVGLLVFYKYQQLEVSKNDYRYGDCIKIVFQ